MILNMTNGGSAKLPAIYVTYPAGSIVTCTKEGRTKKASDTSGFALFANLEIGAWVVTLTDGAKTISKTVEITAEGQSVSVALRYLVPAEYQAVEYLEATGTQCINTGINANTITTSEEVRAKVAVSSIADNTSYAIIGASGNSYNNTSAIINIGAGRAALYFAGFFKQTSNVAVAANTLAEIVAKGVKNGTCTLMIDGTTVLSGTGATSSIQAKEIYIFAVNLNGPERYLSGRIYSLQLFVDDVLVRDFIPCYRKSDSVAGMWDAVSEKFFTNAGSGTFIVGADI